MAALWYHDEVTDQTFFEHLNQIRNKISHGNYENVNSTRNTLNLIFFMKFSPSTFCTISKWYFQNFDISFFSLINIITCRINCESRNLLYIFEIFCCLFLDFNKRGIEGKSFKCKGW